MCRDNDGSWDDSKRASRGCVRVDLEPVTPHPLPFGTVRLPVWLGRRPEPGIEDRRGRRVSWRHPPDDPDEGCPGAWRLSPFVDSLAPFLRRRDDNGNRVANALYDRCDDELIIALVHYYEDEHEQCIAAIYSAAEARKKREERGRGGTT